VARDDRVDVLDSWVKWLGQCEESLKKEELNKMDEAGYAPLHYAAKFNHIKILRRLIMKGAGKGVA